MTPIACWFVAYAVFIFCIAYYGRINPDFALWLINKAEEAEQKRQEQKEQSRKGGK